MKVTLQGRITQGRDGIYRAPIIIGYGPSARIIQLDLDANYEPDSPEPNRPLYDGSLIHEDLWVYRGNAVLVKGGIELSLDEVRVKIKHAVLRHDKAFERMRREIEALENVERVDVARRARISNSGRLFVWQRDQGKCVKWAAAGFKDTELSV